MIWDIDNRKHMWLAADKLILTKKSKQEPFYNWIRLFVYFFLLKPFSSVSPESVASLSTYRKIKSME